MQYLKKIQRNNYNYLFTYSIGAYTQCNAFNITVLDNSETVT